MSRSISAPLGGLRVGPLVRGVSGRSVLLLVWASVVLPAGGIFGVNVKMSIFLLAVLALVLESIVEPDRRAVRLGHLAVASAMLFVVTIAFFVAIVRDSTPLGYSIGALQGFVSTIGVAFVIIVAAWRGSVSWRAVLRAFLFGAFAYSVAKIAMVAAIYGGLVEFAAVRTFFLNVFDYSFVSMMIVPGLVRAQFINDVTLPLALAVIVLFARSPVLRIPPWLTTVIAAAYLLAVLLAFSRWLLFFAAVVVLAWFALFGIRRAATIAATLFLGFAGLALMLAVVDVPALSGALVARFDSPAVEASDAVRRTQILALVDEIARTPVFGKGIGSYAPEAIQSVRQPYTYEVQWLAILLQLGVVGSAIVVLPLLGLLATSMLAPDGRQMFVVFMVVSLWLVSGFTNPYLISSTSGVVFGVLAILPLAWRDWASVDVSPR